MCVKLCTQVCIALYELILCGQYLQCISPRLLTVGDASTRAQGRSRARGFHEEVMVVTHHALCLHSLDAVYTGHPRTLRQLH